MPAPSTTPVKTPTRAPVRKDDPDYDPDPERWIREICPEQTERHTFPGVIFPG